MFSKEKFHGSEIDIFEQVMMCVSYLLNLTSQRTVNIKKIMLLSWREENKKNKDCGFSICTNKNQCDKDVIGS